MSIPFKHLDVYLAGGASAARRAPVMRAPRPAELRQTFLPLAPVDSDPPHPALGPEGCLPFDLFARVYQEAAAMGLLSLTLTGSAPFLHPEWDRFVEFFNCPLSADSPASVRVETGGEGVTLPRARALAALLSAGRECSAAVGITWPAAEHREGEAGFRLALNAVELLSSAGLPVQVAVRITQKNISRVPEIIRQAEELGARELALFTGRQAGVDGNVRIEELFALGRRVERHYAPRTSLRLVFDQPPAFLGLSKQHSGEGLLGCQTLHSLCLLEGGEIALCAEASRAPELLLGRAGDESLADIWRDHPLLHDLRSRLPGSLQGICGGCALKTACKGYCPSQTYLLTGSFFDGYWFCQEAAEAGLFPAGRISEA